jgi:hypothetical protein
MASLSLFARLISHQPAVLFSQNESATSNQPAVLFSQNKPAPANRTGCLLQCSIDFELKLIRIEKQSS